MGIAMFGSVISCLSFMERRPWVLAWRLGRSLRKAPFSSMPGASFSSLRNLRAEGERSFSRTTLQLQLVNRIRAALMVKDKCVIVGGPGGVGKSVFWEDFLQKRPPQPVKGGGMWNTLEGPVRVVNLLKC
jgi:hypothetical protein